MNKLELQQKRWIVRILWTALYLIIPFIQLKGESILRFDIPSLGLLFFGKTVYIENFFIVLVFTFFITFLIILITQLYGRIWCGWLCPQTVVMNFTKFLDIKGQSFAAKLFGHIVVFAVSAIIGGSMVWYFVSPYKFFAGIANGTLGSATLWFFIVLTVITYLNFAFVRYKFCTTVCPYSKLQSVMFDSHTLIIAMDPETSYKCVKCQACVTTCPVGIDIRQGMDSQCINCGRCISACTKTMAAENEDVPTLIDYIYGFSNTKKPFRTNVMITGAVTLLFLLGFIYMTATMKPYEFQVFPNQSFLPRVKDGQIINSYEVMVRNLTKNELNIRLSIKDFEDYELQYQPVSVAPDETFREKVFLFIPAEMLEKKPILSLTMLSEGDDKAGKPLESELSFRRPLTRNKQEQK
jgi:cytochrome c oxidase accessory protein FixG